VVKNFAIWNHYATMAQKNKHWERKTGTCLLLKRQVKKKMYTEAQHLNNDARAWVYAASRTLSGEEQKKLEENLTAFCEGWSSHGVPVRSSWVIRENQFVVLMAEEGPSGCSIDSSVRMLKQAGAALGIDFFDRRIPFQTETGISLVALPDLSSFLKQQSNAGQLMTINTLADKKTSVDKDWLIPVSKSWMSRYLTEHRN